MKKYKNTYENIFKHRKTIQNLKAIIFLLYPEVLCMERFTFFNAEEGNKTTYPTESLVLAHPFVCDQISVVEDLSPYYWHMTNN